MIPKPRTAQDFPAINTNFSFHSLGIFEDPVDISNTSVLSDNTNVNRVFKDAVIFYHRENESWNWY